MNRNKRILVAVDNSKASMRAVNYVANIIAGKRDFLICLLHVLGPLPPELREFGGSEDPQTQDGRPSGDDDIRTEDFTG